MSEKRPSTVILLRCLLPCHVQRRCDTSPGTHVPRWENLTRDGAQAGATTNIRRRGAHKASGSALVVDVAHASGRNRVARKEGSPSFEMVGSVARLRAGIPAGP